MPIAGFFKRCNYPEGFSIPVEINFEYDYKKKTIVTKGILNYFARDLAVYSRSKSVSFDREAIAMDKRLFRHIDE